MITPTRIGKQYKPHGASNWSVNTRYIYGAFGEMLAQYDGASPQYWNILAGGETIGRRHAGRVIRGQERAYYLKDHLGSVRVTVTEDGTVLGWDDYYPFGLQNLSRPFGMDGRSSNSANTHDDMKFTGHFLEQEGGLGIYHAVARLYEPETGRFWGVDAMRSEMPGWNTYHYTFNNPVRYVDPDGNLPWLVGGIVGAAFDYGTQVAVNYATGKENPWTDVDTKSIAVSAVAGATGVGLISQAGKMFNGKTLKGAEMVIDGTVNSVEQYVNKGEVDFIETAVAMGLGQTVRSPVRDNVKAKAEPKLQQLDKDASKAQRYARNAEEKGSRSGKVQRLQNEADAAKKNAANAKTQTNMKATASGASASAGLGRGLNSINKKEDEKK